MKATTTGFTDEIPPKLRIHTIYGTAHVKANSTIPTTPFARWSGCDDCSGYADYATLNQDG